MGEERDALFIIRGLLDVRRKSREREEDGATTVQCRHAGTAENGMSPEISRQLLL